RCVWGIRAARVALWVAPCLFVVFFQAEDGIRDWSVTGVQTCALPIWGLAWGILVFGELHGRGLSIYAQVIGGSLLMAAGAGAIALSSVTGKEHGRWHEAAHREGKRYGVSAEYVQAGLAGEDSNDENTGKRAQP